MAYTIENFYFFQEGRESLKSKRQQKVLEASGYQSQNTIDTVNNVQGKVFFQVEERSSMYLMFKNLLPFISNLEA